MLRKPPPLRIQKRYKPKLRKRTTPVLELVTAVYSINDALVTLTFNRAINTDDLDVSVFWINDGIYTQEKLQGDSFTIGGDNSVLISFVQTESYTGTTTTLDAAANNGIKDASTGAEWSGVSGLELTIG